MKWRQPGSSSGTGCSRASASVMLDGASPLLRRACTAWLGRGSQRCDPLGTTGLRHRQPGPRGHCRTHAAGVQHPDRGHPTLGITGTIRTPPDP